MAALMKTRNILVFTHDSIGLGEDGPTHQPIEHLASLRAMPNMSVWRPCDAVETAVAWRAALERLQQTRRAVYRQTRKAYLGVVSQISSVKALRQAVISSETALESTRAGFKVGTRTAIDVVAAERGLSQARRDYARAKYDYILEILQLKQAAGSLRPEDIAIANSWLDDSSRESSIDENSIQ